MALSKKITNMLFIILCIMPLIINPFFLDYFYYPKIIFVYIVLLIMSIQWSSSSKPKQRVDYIEKIIALYLTLLVISTLFSINVKTSLVGLKTREEGLFAIFAYIMLFYFSKRYYQISKEQLRYYLLSVSVVAIYGILQYYQLDPIPRDYIRIDWYRIAFSTIGNPNFLGSYLIIALPISMYSYIRFKRDIYLLTTLLIYMCLLFTLTRSAWLGAILSITILIFYAAILKYDKKYIVRTLVLITILTILFNLYNGNSFINRFFTIYQDVNKLIVQSPDLEKAGSNRIFIWIRALKLIKQNPIWGTGLETFEIAFTTNFGKDLVDQFGGGVVFDKAHNEYLHIAVSTGIPSLIVYLTFISTIIIKGFRQIKNNHLILPLFCSVVGYLVQAFFNFSVVSVAPIFWIFLGVLYKVSDETEKTACKKVLST